MENLAKLNKDVALLTLALGLIGTIGLTFVNIIYAASFFAGTLIGLAYLCHLAFTVGKLSPDKKHIFSFIRLALSVLFVILITHIFSLNIFLVISGFMINHLSMLLYFGFRLIKDRVGSA